MGDSYAQVVLGDHPLAYWRFDEKMPPIAADSATGAHPGTYAPGVTLGAKGAIVGHDGGAAAFDNGEELVAMGNVFSFEGRATFSLEAWIFPTALDMEYRRVFAKETIAGTREGYDVYVRDSGDGAVGVVKLERYHNDTYDAAGARAAALNEYS